MKTIDIQGMTNMELVREGTDEWYWATDYIHGGLYEAEKLFRQGHPVRSNRLYLIHYPDGTVYEAVSSTNRVISTPICAFCRRSLGGFSIVSVQPCPLFSRSGSKVGQRL